jgi:hypothetical protein
VLPHAGLGNRLFPWARCRVFSLLHRAPMLAPAWAQLKLGPIVRGEIDYRIYHNLFRHHPTYVRGLKRTLVRVVASEVKEPPTLGSPVGGAGTVIVKFEGQAAAFAPLTGWHEHLYRELRAITRNRWLDAVDQFPHVPIGVHVRCGDFAPPMNAEDLQTKGNIRTPLEWFIDCLETIRNAVGAPVRAYVVSDGRAGELKELLTTPNVVLARTGSAISDLLLLARARVLVASGSSFSAWASFLGEMPTVSHPGQSLTWFNLQETTHRYVGELDPNSPPVSFLAQARATLCDGGRAASGPFTRLERGYAKAVTRTCP